MDIDLTDEEIVASNYLLTYLLICALVMDIDLMKKSSHQITYLLICVLVMNTDLMKKSSSVTQKRVRSVVQGKTRQKRKTRQIIAATNTISISQCRRRRLNRHQHHIHHILRSYSLVCFKGVGRNDLR